MQNKFSKFQTLGLESNKPQRSIINIGVVVLNVVTFAVTMFINAASASPSLGIFKNSTGVISNNNEVDITPAGWTFSTWGIIYAWQAAWLLYNIILIFIKSDSVPLYLNPPVLTIVFHIIIFANFCFNMGWLFAWDSENFGVSFGVILMITLTLYAALVLSHKNIYDAEQFLVRDKAKYLWLYRILVNNGLMFYATWVTIATALNFAIALTYEWNGNRSTSSIIALSVVALIVLVNYILEMFVFEKFMRYTYSHYLQLTIAFAGILSKNWSAQSPSAIFTLVLIIIAPGLMSLSKIIFSIYKHKNRRSL